MCVQSGSFAGVKMFHMFVSKNVSMFVRETFEDLLPVVTLFITLWQIPVIFGIFVTY